MQTRLFNIINYNVTPSFGADLLGLTYHSLFELDDTNLISRKMSKVVADKILYIYMAVDIIIGNLPHSAGHREGLIPRRVASLYSSQSGDQVAMHCDGGCRGAAGGTQLAEDTGNVESHSGRAYHHIMDSSTTGTAHRGY